VGSDANFPKHTKILPLFQSTLPVWGATISLRSINPSHPISIHAPRVGSDIATDSCDSVHTHFNPRSPCGERQKTCAAL